MGSPWEAHVEPSFQAELEGRGQAGQAEAEWTSEFVVQCQELWEACEHWPNSLRSFQRSSDYAGSASHLLSNFLPGITSRPLLEVVLSGLSIPLNEFQMLIFCLKDEQAFP